MMIKPEREVIIITRGLMHFFQDARILIPFKEIIKIGIQS